MQDIQARDVLNAVLFVREIENRKAIFAANPADLS
jgi:hypothetical protein